MIRLRTLYESIGGFPPGAANDPRAPYNSRPVRKDTDEFKTSVEDDNGDSHDVQIDYQSYKHDGTTYIDEYSYEFKTKPVIKSEYIDELIRGAISDKVGGSVEFS